MINRLLSWLRLRQDTLTKAKEALENARQIIRAQEITIEEQRKLIDRVLYINNELLKEGP